MPLTAGPPAVPLLVRVDGVLRRHRRLAVLVWLLALVAAAPLAMRQADELTGGGFEAPASDSALVQREIEEGFPGVRGAPLAVVLVPRAGAGPGDLAAAVTEAAGPAARGEGVRVPDPAPVLEAATARPDRTVLLPVDFAGGEGAAIDVGAALRTQLGVRGDQAGSAAGGRGEVHVAGEGALWAAFQEQAKKDVSAAEARAFPVLVIVLLVAFGSLAAAALPLVLGVVTTLLTSALIYLISLQLEMSVFVTNIVSMIGIGVAVDYSLFVVARFREELRAGLPPDRARAVAMGTSGTAVAFSGVTVMASMAALFLVDSTGLRSMAIGAIVVVAVAVLVTSALLPVLLSLLGARFAARAYAGRHRPVRPGFWQRWTDGVLRRPVLSLLLALAGLLTLAAPALSLAVGNSALRQLDPEHELRRGTEAASVAYGPGSLGPAWVLVTAPAGAQDSPAVAAVRAAAAADPQVVRVEPPGPGRDRRTARVGVVFRTDPESPEARAAVDRLRTALPAAVGDAATVRVGGTTATLVDFDRLVERKMPLLLAVVLLLSFVVLVVVLRSLLLPLKAVLTNALSVAAGYGVLVAVFQWGWLSGLGLEPAPAIDSITPPLVLAVAFGLSMDYEVFLLSRIRERRLATGDDRIAVAEGLASSARTISSAALVMVAVFLAFVSAGLPSVQRLGLACAVAIALDATVVRLVLVPAAMVLLGRWNWWLPGWLARVLPTVRLDERPDPPVPHRVPPRPHHPREGYPHHPREGYL